LHPLLCLCPLPPFALVNQPDMILYIDVLSKRIFVANSWVKSSPSCCNEHLITGRQTTYMLNRTLENLSTNELNLILKLSSILLSIYAAKVKLFKHFRLNHEDLLAGVLFAIAELYQWAKHLTLPLPIYILGGAFW